MGLEVIAGLGILAYFSFTIWERLNDKDELQEFLKLMTLFFFLFILLMIPDYLLYIAESHINFFIRLVVFTQWFLRIIVSVTGVLIIKKVFEWVIDLIGGWFGK